MIYEITFYRKGTVAKPSLFDGEIYLDEKESQERFDELVKDSRFDNIRRAIVLESYAEGFPPRTGIREVS